VPRFPLFINLEGRFCLVAGGGAAAARKVQALLDFGAALTVVDPVPSDKIRSLEQRGRLSIRERPYGGPAEIAGAALVIAATNDRELNARVARDARAAAIPVNVADDPTLCSFFFPALVRRGDLVAGISTSGACPRLAARLREALEESWPENLGAALERLTEKRRWFRASLDPAERIRRLDELITLALEGTGNAGSGEEKPPMSGKVRSPAAGKAPMSGEVRFGNRESADVP
jgi:siroheme synthase-like protein